MNGHIFGAAVDSENGGQTSGEADFEHRFAQKQIGFVFAVDDVVERFAKIAHTLPRVIDDVIYKNVEMKIC